MSCWATTNIFRCNYTFTSILLSQCKFVKAISKLIGELYMFNNIILTLSFSSKIKNIIILSFKISYTKLFYLPYRNILFNDSSMCSHCNQSKRKIDHMATRCKKMLGHNYIRRHNEILSRKRLRTHLVKQIIANKFIEIRVDTSIKTDVKIRYNKLDIVVIDNKFKEFIIFEIAIIRSINNSICANIGWYMILNITYECMLLEYRRRENLNTK
ncbi:hypothetical protein NAPIS_ORF00025 [Vairimorpha apis BRL 01]|uniref:Uncharacterized protein n=1 Tax=Vairimorpha apis BRL 01 TaxID=1037528 RepID=T0L4I1_9MICR|nr:hypothetical protein NAPIS_ORF00025 [Vairimorpha apis BRL 01]